MFSQTIILASASPARRKLLEDAGFHVLVEPTHVQEVWDNAHPECAAAQIAELKMAAYRKEHPRISTPVLTADTVILHNNRILGKPEDRRDASRMLRELSGNVHQVISAAVFFDPGTGDPIRFENRASVRFAQLSDESIDSYLDTREWEHAAGSYRIQHRGIRLISSIEGDYFSVIGLPLMDFFGIVRARM
jgi:septum formation protein